MPYHSPFSPPSANPKRWAFTAVDTIIHTTHWNVLHSIVRRIGPGSGL
jgi:hypothetical protein